MLRFGAPLTKPAHQFDDLPKLMETYQIWAHELFPRLKFDAFIDRAEKVCHERRVKVHLEQWRRDRLRKMEDPEFVEEDFAPARNPFDSHSDSDDDRRGGMAGAPKADEDFGFGFIPSASAVDAGALARIEENKRAALARLEEKKRERERMQAALAAEEEAHRELEREMEDEAAMEAERERDEADRTALAIPADDEFGDLDAFDLDGLDLEHVEVAVVKPTEPSQNVNDISTADAGMMVDVVDDAESKSETSPNKAAEVEAVPKTAESTTAATIPPEDAQMDEAALAAALFGDDEMEF